MRKNSEDYEKVIGEFEVIEKVMLAKKNFSFVIEIIKTDNGFIVKNTYSKGKQGSVSEKGPFESLEEAKELYQMILSKKKKEKYKEQSSTLSLKKPKSKFLDALYKYLYNPSLVEKYLQEKGYDICCKPLQSISLEVLENSHKLLLEIEQNLLSNSESALPSLSQLYYSNIPHFLSLLKSSIINTPQKLLQQENLLTEIQHFQYIFTFPDPATSLSPLVPNTEIYEMISASIQSAAGLSLISKTLTIDGICRVDVKLNESIRTNKRLLWLRMHPHSIPNILANGLSLPQLFSPSLPYEFNKGVYFSDNICAVLHDFSESAYLLCEVALGKSTEKFNQDFMLNTSGCDSVKGCGKYYPSSFFTIEDALLPETFKEGVSGIAFTYNLFSIYDLAQISLKFLVKVSIN